MFQNKIVVITGGAQGLGKCMREAFEREGATVCTIDLLPNDYFVGDIAHQSVLDAFIQKVISDHGHIDVLVNNAKPQLLGIDRCSYDDFDYALRVGITAPFYLAQQFYPHFSQGGSIVNISSSRDRMSQRNSESYTAAKGGLTALTHGLAISMGSKVRVNSIAPGWIDTTGATFSGPDSAQHPVGRVGIPSDIANLALFLASDKAGFITGEDIVIDGGTTRQLVYHGDFGWELHS